MNKEPSCNYWAPSGKKLCIPGEIYRFFSRHQRNHKEGIDPLTGIWSINEKTCHWWRLKKLLREFSPNRRFEESAQLNTDIYILDLPLGTRFGLVIYNSPISIMKCVFIQSFNVLLEELLCNICDFPLSLQSW